MIADAPSPTDLPCCDIVMKGGITSGIVYPGVVAELARHYRFRNVGGTSAGAIAAALTAAAQCGARRGGDPWPEVRRLPAWLGTRAPGTEEVPDTSASNLLSLFRPQERTRPLYRLLLAALSRNPRRLVAESLKAFPLAALLSALPGLALAAVALVWGQGGPLAVASLLAAAVLVAVGVPVGVLGTAGRSAARELPENFYGLTTGWTEEGPGPSLTPWLHSTLNRLAGRDPAGPPLTFGELWDPRGFRPGHEVSELREAPEVRDVHLEMMTTCLSHGRPYRLPLDTKIFYFDPEEMRRFFPEGVVQHLERHARELEPREEELPLGNLRPLPEARDLPVVLATRLSLSFPLLISAVPLHAIDFSRKLPREERQPERCWFSDGGISSNFPVHFFDQPLPAWPTFAVNLKPYHPDHGPDTESGKEGVWMPRRNSGGLLERWTRFEEVSPAGRRGSLAGFVGALLDAMQNWMDNTQMRLPGYRDRVAHVLLDESREGGLNLDMDPQVIEAVSRRGEAAGRLLAQRFQHPTAEEELTWDNHRWVRYRSTMALLEELLAELQGALEAPEAGDRSFVELITRGKADPPTSYRWKRNAQRDFALRRTEELLELARRWAAEDQTFAEGSPSPDPELRITPRV